MDFQNYEISQDSINKDFTILYQMKDNLKAFKEMFLKQAQELSLAKEAGVFKSIEDYFYEIEYDVIGHYEDSITKADHMEKDEIAMYYSRVL